MATGGKDTKQHAHGLETNQTPVDSMIGKADGKNVDIFRDTPIRLLGYCNEVGEAFRSFIPRALVYATYGVSSCYALADASSKAHTVHKRENRMQRSEGANRMALEMFLEASLWQGLASVAIPGFTINRICALATYAFRKAPMAKILPVQSHRFIVTAIGLCSIPFIIKPIDRATDAIVESVVITSRHMGLSHQLPHEDQQFHEILENTAEFKILLT